MLFAKQAIGLTAMAILLTLLRPQAVLAEDKLQIYAVNYPLAYFAERVAGDLADVTFPAPPGADPAFWMPDADTIADYQAAGLSLKAHPLSFQREQLTNWESLPPTSCLDFATAAACWSPGSSFSVSGPARPKASPSSPWKTKPAWPT